MCKNRKWSSHLTAVPKSNSRTALTTKWPKSARKYFERTKRPTTADIGSRFIRNSLRHSYRGFCGSLAEEISSARHPNTRYSGGVLIATVCCFWEEAITNAKRTFCAIGFNKHVGTINSVAVRRCKPSRLLLSKRKVRRSDPSCGTPQSLPRPDGPERPRARDGRRAPRGQAGPERVP